MPPSLFVPDLTTIRPADQASGGVRGGTIRLLPVDSKAEAKRSSLYPSQEPPAQTNPKLK